MLTTNELRNILDMLETVQKSHGALSVTLFFTDVNGDDAGTGVYDVGMSCYVYKWPDEQYD